MKSSLHFSKHHLEFFNYFAARFSLFSFHLVFSKVSNTFKLKDSFYEARKTVVNLKKHAWVARVSDVLHADCTSRLPHTVLNWGLMFNAFYSRGGSCVDWRFTCRVVILTCLIRFCHVIFWLIVQTKNLVDANILISIEMEQSFVGVILILACNLTNQSDFGLPLFAVDVTRTVWFHWPNL